MKRLAIMFMLALALALLSSSGIEAKPKPQKLWTCPYVAILEIEQSHIEGRVVIYDDGSFRLFTDDGSGLKQTKFIAWDCDD